jgi:RNA polymerase-binding transcription factor DksA
MPKKPVKKVVAKKAAAKKAPAKKAPAKKAPAKKAAVKKVAKKAPAKKAVAKKVAKKSAPAKKPAVKSIPVKKAPGKPFPSKTTLTVDEKSQTVSVSTISAPVVAPVVEERRLVMPPVKKVAPLKPIKVAPTPVVVSENESPWTAAEIKGIKAEISKELDRLRKELAVVEQEMDALIQESGEGAGDDQADAGTKTFEREHEMSLVINARDMVLQTERALERIENKTYGNCEECGSPIGKARLQVFPRATLCMLCKQKEERR